MNPTNEHDYEGPLARLDDIDNLEVTDDTDIRGWRVLGKGGSRLGQVRQLVVDPAALKVLYLETYLHVSGRRILVPLEATTLDHPEQCVLVQIGVDETAALPNCPIDITHDFQQSYEAEWRRRWGGSAPDDVPMVRLRHC